MTRARGSTPRSSPHSRRGNGSTNGHDLGLRNQIQAILYIDHQSLTRYCVSEQLALHLPEASVETASTISDVSKEDVQARRFTLAILRTHAIGEDELAHELASLGEAAPGLPIILFSDIDDADQIAKAFELGIRGYIPTSLPIEQAVEAIRFVSTGGCFVPHNILSHLTRRESSTSKKAGSVNGFTHRQLQVLERLCQGKQNKAIAYDLNMCESTVKVHIRHIMKKLKAHNRTEVAFLMRSCLQDGPG
jgi:DNA-binding NarL/FixJ family response regulator